MNSLIIKNISNKLSYGEREDLFRHFGGQSVTNWPNKSFVVFENEFKSREAMTRLHQLLVLGQRLCVEFAVEDNTSAMSRLPALNEPHLRETKSNEESLQTLKELKLRQFLNQINYISPALGLNYLPSPLLRYSYPEASHHIVDNISDTLLSHPRFYTQVLHLMNKMNLPVPFTGTPGAHRHSFETNVDNFEVKSVSIDSSESELEMSDTEDTKPLDEMWSKAKAKTKKKVIKKLKTGFVGEKSLLKSFERKDKRMAKTVQRIPDVFPEVQTISTIRSQPSIEVKIVSDCRTLSESHHTKAPSLQLSSGFGILSAEKRKETQKCSDIVLNTNDIITDEELSSNRVLKSQWTKYPVFRGYSSGQSSCRLYIKNIDKSVETNDLMRIYIKFIDIESEEHKNMFDIRLMRTGRMKGQAFITFPNEMIAEKALNDTNGYLFNDKPIVVAFARTQRPQQLID